ncbi:hypothetical protein HMPREF1870_01042 [Bacteroidales bacterium KA00344]|nr:hypothetical protein HMPREF1870_01042 [Bacteroidales bacterium KA00344]
MLCGLYLVLFSFDVDFTIDISNLQISTQSLFMLMYSCSEIYDT